MPTDAEKLLANLALVDEARVTELLNDIPALLSETERAQIKSYACGAAGFNLLMAEVGVDVANRKATTSQEEMSMRMAVARYYQGLQLQEEIRRAPELEVH